MDKSHYDKLVIEAVKKAAPAVVSIMIAKFMDKAKALNAMPGMPPIIDEKKKDGSKERVRVGGGSGFVAHPDGRILTNKHVVFDEDAEYTVVTADNTEYPAKVLSRDPVN